MHFSRWIYLSLAVQAYGSPASHTQRNLPFDQGQPTSNGGKDSHGTIVHVYTPGGPFSPSTPSLNPIVVDHKGKNMKTFIAITPVGGYKLAPSEHQAAKHVENVSGNDGLNAEEGNVMEQESGDEPASNADTTISYDPEPLVDTGSEVSDNTFIAPASLKRPSPMPAHGNNSPKFFHPLEQTNRDAVDICKSYAFEPSQTNYLLAGTDDWLKEYAKENSYRPYYQQHGLMSTIAFDFLGINNFRCSVGTEHLCHIDCPTVVNSVQDLELARNIFFALSSASNLLTITSIIHGSLESAQNNVGLMAQKMAYDFNWWHPSEDERKREVAHQFFISTMVWGVQTIFNNAWPMIPWKLMQDYVGKKASTALDRIDDFRAEHPVTIPELKGDRIWDAITCVLKVEANRDSAEWQPTSDALSPVQRSRWTNWVTGGSLNPWRTDSPAQIDTFESPSTPEQVSASSVISSTESQTKRLVRRGDYKLPWGKQKSKDQPQAESSSAQPSPGEQQPRAASVTDQKPNAQEASARGPSIDGFSIQETGGSPRVASILSQSGATAGAAPENAQAVDASADVAPSPQGSVEGPTPEQIVKDAWGPEVDALFDGNRAPTGAETTKAAEEQVNNVKEDIAGTGDLREYRFAVLSNKLDRARQRLKIFMPVVAGLALPVSVREIYGRFCWKGSEISRDANAANLGVMIAQSGQASRRFLKERVNGMFLNPNIKPDGSNELIDALALGSFVAAARDSLGHWSDSNVETALTKNLFMRTLNVSWKTQRIWIMCTEDILNKKNPNTVSNKNALKIDHWEHDNSGPQVSKTQVGNKVCYAYRWCDRSMRMGHRVEDPYGLETLSGEPWNIKISDIITSSVLASQLPPSTDLEMLSNSARLASGPTAEFISDPTTPGMFNLPVCNTAWNWNGPTTGVRFRETDLNPDSGHKILPCYCGPLGADTPKIWEQLRLDTSGRKSHYYKDRCPHQIEEKIENPLERYVALCRLGVKNYRAGRAWNFGKDMLCDVVIDTLEKRGIKVVENDMTEDQIAAFMCKIDSSYKNKNCNRFRGTPVTEAWREAEELSIAAPASRGVFKKAWGAVKGWLGN